MRLLITLIAALSAPPAPQPGQAPHASPEGSHARLSPGGIAGKVTLIGLAPPLAPIPVTKDARVCGKDQPDRSLELGTGGRVRGAVIWLTPIGQMAPAKPSSKKVRLKVEGCELRPRVLAVPVGSRLELENGDALYHDVKGTGAETFDFALLLKNYIVPVTLKRQGTVQVSSSVHPWMRAWVQVLPVPWVSVTSAEGTYRIEGVPPGRYQLHLWHERLAEQTLTVEVQAAETLEQDFSLPAR